MKKKYLLLGLSLAGLLAAALYGWQYAATPQPPLAPAPVAHKPKQADQRVPSRCQQSRATQASLLLNNDTLWTKATTEILSLPGSFVLQNGRHKGSQAMALDAFLVDHPEVSALELISCVGEPQHYIADQLRADPGRYILVTNSAGIFKLIEKTNGEYQKKPRQKNIFQIRLISNTSAPEQHSPAH